MIEALRVLNRAVNVPAAPDLRARIVACEPRLAGLLGGCRFAVNGRFAADEQTLADDDEIALIGYVSGG